VYDTMPSWSLGLLCRITTLTSSRQLIGKLTSQSGGAGWQVQQSDALGNIQVKVAAATTALSYISNTTPLAPVGTWRFVGVVMNFAGGAGQAGHIYVSKDLTSPMTEVGYGTQTNPSGAQSGDSGVTLLLGNIGTSPANAFQGDIALAWLVPNIIFGLNEFLDWQEHWWNPPRGCKGFWWIGAEGSGVVLDRSGNIAHGTITGATLGQGPPLLKVLPKLWPNVAAAAILQIDEDYWNVPLQPVQQFQVPMDWLRDQDIPPYFALNEEFWTTLPSLSRTASLYWFYDEEIMVLGTDEDYWSQILPQLQSFLFQPWPHQDELSFLYTDEDYWAPGTYSAQSFLFQQWTQLPDELSFLYTDEDYWQSFPSLLPFYVYPQPWFIQDEMVPQPATPFAEEDYWQVYAPSWLQNVNMLFLERDDPTALTPFPRPFKTPFAWPPNYPYEKDRIDWNDHQIEKSRRWPPRQ
jgi:hypothetical protein